LCFHPPQNCKIFRPIIQLNEVCSSLNLCLNSYEERIGAKIRSEDLCFEKSAQSKDLIKNALKRNRNDSSSDKSSLMNELKKAKSEDNNQDDFAVIYEYKSNDSNDSDSKKKDVKLYLNKIAEENVEKFPEVVVAVEEKREIVDLELTKHKLIENFSIARNKKTILNPAKCNKEFSFKPLITEEALRKIREGWTLQSACDLTIGDLYLMYGSDAKLFLEYKFLEPQHMADLSYLETKTQNIGNKLKHLLMVASIMEDTTTSTNSNISFNRNNEKSLLNDGKEVIENGTFKLPSCDNHLRPNMNPRLKRWWRNQQVNRYRSDGLVPNHSNNNINNQNNVVRNLYQTPSTSHSNEHQISGREFLLSEASNSGQKYSDEVTKILEDKIQNLSKPGSSNSSAVQNFSESSRSSIKSLLESLSSSSNRSRIDQGMMVVKL
jgi:hypothetical protein